MGLPAPSSPLLAGLEGLVVAAVLLGIGYLLVEPFARRLDLDRVTRWALAFPAIVVWALVLQVVHMATGGRVWSNPWLVRGLTLAVAAALLWLRTRRPAETEDRTDGRLAVGLALLGVVLWGIPAFRMAPLAMSGDTIWSMGWTGQLLNGHTTPSAAITGAVPNYYPWMFHALAALTARFAPPGDRAFQALPALQFLQVTGAVLALYALGRTVARRASAGAFAALLGALAGGFGFVLLRGLDVVVEPRNLTGVPGPDPGLRYLGDFLFKRSYNLAFHNIAPTFPRDVAFSLLSAFLLLLALGLVRRRPLLLLGAGIVLGLVGLTGGETFIVGLGVAVVACLAAIGLPRPRTAALVLGPAVAIYALWLVPLLVTYIRLDGFVNITIVPPVVLTPAAILVSWGVATPLAAFGAVRWIPRARTDPGARLVLVVLVVAGALLVASELIPDVLGPAFLTLGRRHRYWPLLYLGVALLGALGASDLLHRLRTRTRGLAIGFAVLVVGLALPSPFLASLALPDKIGEPPDLAAALRGDERNVLSVLASEGRRCSAAVPSGLLSLEVFSFTGFPLALADWNPDRTQNRARIRWRGIYGRIGSERQRLLDNRVLTEGLADRASWLAIAERYGLDLVVTGRSVATRSTFSGLERIPATASQGPVTVVVSGSCA